MPPMEPILLPGQYKNRNVIPDSVSDADLLTFGPLTDNFAFYLTTSPERVTLYDGKKQHKAPCSKLMQLFDKATAADNLEDPPPTRTSKEKVMKDILLCKFTQNPILLLRLLNDDRYIINANKDDPFWGNGPQYNRNALGHILMEIRDELRLELTDFSRIQVRESLNKELSQQLNIPFTQRKPRYITAQKLQEIQKAPNVRVFLAHLNPKTEAFQKAMKPKSLTYQEMFKKAKTEEERIAIARAAGHDPNFIPCKPESMNYNVAQFQNNGKGAFLLDVDGTLLLGDPPDVEINTKLVDALLAQGINDIYLFSSMSLRDAVLKPDNVSRPALIAYLSFRGITVRGVITETDALANEELGGLYKKEFYPLIHTHPWRAGEEQKLNDFKPKLSQAKQENDAMEPPELKGEAGLKGLMCQRVLEENPGINTLTIIDDLENNLIGGQRVLRQMQERDKAQGVRLNTVHTVKVNSADNVTTDYAQAFARSSAPKEVSEAHELSFLLQRISDRYNKIQRFIKNDENVDSFVRIINDMKAQLDGAVSQGRSDVQLGQLLEPIRAKILLAFTGLNTLLLVSQPNLTALLSAYDDMVTFNLLLEPWFRHYDLEPVTREEIDRCLTPDALQKISQQKAQEQRDNEARKLQLIKGFAEKEARAKAAEIEEADVDPNAEFQKLTEAYSLAYQDYIQISDDLTQWSTKKEALAAKLNKMEETIFALKRFEATLAAPFGELEGKIGLLKRQIYDTDSHFTSVNKYWQEFKDSLKPENILSGKIDKNKEQKTQKIKEALARLEPKRFELAQDVLTGQDPKKDELFQTWMDASVDDAESLSTVLQTRRAFGAGKQSPETNSFKKAQLMLQTAQSRGIYSGITKATESVVHETTARNINPVAANARWAIIQEFKSNLEGQIESSKNTPASWANPKISVKDIDEMLKRLATLTPMIQAERSRFTQENYDDMEEFLTTSKTTIQNRLADVQRADALYSKFENFISNEMSFSIHADSLDEKLKKIYAALDRLNVSKYEVIRDLLNQNPPPASLSEKTIFQKFLGDREDSNSILYALQSTREVKFWPITFAKPGEQKETTSSYRSAVRWIAAQSDRTINFSENGLKSIENPNPVQGLQRS